MNLEVLSGVNFQAVHGSKFSAYGAARQNSKRAADGWNEVFDQLETARGLLPRCFGRRRGGNC